MPFENNDTLQRWHMTNTPPEIDKYDTHKKCCLTNMAHLAHLPRTELSNFKKGNS